MYGDGGREPILVCVVIVVVRTRRQLVAHNTAMSICPPDTGYDGVECGVMFTGDDPDPV